MEINTQARLESKSKTHNTKNTDYIIWNMPRYVVRFFFGFCNYEYSSKIDKFNTLGL